MDINDPKTGLKIQPWWADIYISYSFREEEDTIILHIHFLPDNETTEEIIYKALLPFFFPLYKSFELFEQRFYRKDVERHENYGCLSYIQLLLKNQENRIGSILKEPNEYSRKNKFKDFFQEIFDKF